MNKKDKRSRKTARAVQNALLRLLCERRIDEIKIVDLCTAADINRTTFYLHYTRIGDVLDELRDEITERICRESEAQFDFSVPADPRVGNSDNRRQEPEDRIAEYHGNIIVFPAG